jgi:hypothetical protein
MNDHSEDAAFDAALRRQLHAHPEAPADDGFSLRVMAALPARAAPRRRWARWTRRAHWAAVCIAAAGGAALLPAADVPGAIAAAALLGLAIFWSVPSRWSRG